MIGRRLLTIVFLIAVVVLASAQTTKSMNPKIRKQSQWQSQLQ